MDLYLTTFTLPKTRATSARVDSASASEARSPTGAAALSSSPDARLAGRSAGLAVSPPSALAPGSMRPSPAARSPDAATRGSRSLASLAESQAPRPDTLFTDAVPRVTQKTMNAHHCLVTATPSTDVAAEANGSTATAYNGTSRGPLSPSVPARMPSAAPDAARASSRSASTGAALSDTLPTSCSPRYSFHVCGTQAQALGARGQLLQELPFAWRVAFAVPLADVWDVREGGMRAELVPKLDELQQRAETRITVAPRDAPPSDAGALEVDRQALVTISGALEAVEYARVQLLVLLDERHGLHTEQAEIECKLHHVSSGRKRALLQLIEEETQTSVYLSSPFAGVLSTTVPAAVVQRRNTVYITGRFYKTQRARDMIVQLSQSKAKSLVSKTVTLMPRKVDYLLQERLEALRQLMLDNGTFLELPVIGSQQGSVTVVGTNRVDVERSIRTLMQLVSPYYTAHVWLLPGAYDALSLSSKPDTRALTSIVTAISANTGAEAAFQNNHFEIAGLDREVRAALRQLLAVPSLKHYTYEFRFQLELATDHREFISGKKNGKINKIMEHCGVRIRFEPFNEYNFLIDVLGTELDAALQGLGLLQEELPAEMSFHVPEAYHKRIIGVGGKNIQRIMKKYGVYVKFSNAEEFAALGGYMDNDDNVIARTPSKNAANLENLKNSVMELVSPKDKDFVTESITVPRKYQRMLLGEKASTIHDIERKTRCVVRFVRRESALDAVHVFGPEAQIALAVQMLLQHVPLEADLVLPPGPETHQLLDSPELARLQERLHKELGLALQPWPRAPSGEGARGLTLCVPRAHLEVLPTAKGWLDELCATFHVHTAAPPRASDTYAAPGAMSPFSSSLPSSSPSLAATVHSDTFSHDTAAAHAASVVAVGSRFDDASSVPSAAPGAPSSAPSKDLKALFDQPSAPGSLASNTPLMPSFYTPGYTENASFSHPVWGMPLPSMADMGASKPGAPGAGNTHMPGASPGTAGNAGSSMFSPFSSSAMPFPFTPSDMSLGKPDAAALNSAFAQPLRRPDGMQSGVAPSFAPGAPPPLGRLPLSMHSSINSDIDGFHPIGDSTSHMPMMGAPGSVPSHRHANMGMMRSATSPGAPPDTMDEVSRVLAQIAFDKE